MKLKLSLCWYMKQHLASVVLTEMFTVAFLQRAGEEVGWELFT